MRFSALFSALFIFAACTSTGKRNPLNIDEALTEPYPLIEEVWPDKFTMKIRSEKTSVVTAQNNRQEDLVKKASTEIVKAAIDVNVLERNFNGSQKVEWVFVDWSINFNEDVTFIGPLDEELKKFFVPRSPIEVNFGEMISGRMLSLSFDKSQRLLNPEAVEKFKKETEGDEQKKSLFFQMLDLAIHPKNMSPMDNKNSLIAKAAGKKVGESWVIKSELGSTNDSLDTQCVFRGWTWQGEFRATVTECGYTGTQKIKNGKAEKEAFVKSNLTSIYEPTTKAYSSMLNMQFQMTFDGDELNPKVVENTNKHEFEITPIK